MLNPGFRLRRLDPVKPADIIIYRDGPRAVAVDKYGNRIAESADHASVIERVISSNTKIFLDGEFYIKSQIDISGVENLWIEGGRLVKSANIDCILSISDNQGPESKNIVLSNIVLDGNASKYPTGHNLCIGNLKHGLLINIKSINAYNKALNVYRVNPGSENEQYVPEHVMITGGYFERYSGSDAGAEVVLIGGKHIVMIKPYVNANGSASTGLRVYENTYGHTSDVVIISPYITGAKLYGLFISADNVTVIKPRVENNSGEGIRVYPSGEAITEAEYIKNLRNVVIISPVVRNNGTNGISIFDADAEVIGGIVEENGAIGINVQPYKFDTYNPSEDMFVKIRGVLVRNNAKTTDSHGLYIANFYDVILHVSIDDVNIYDDQDTPTQTRGIEVAGSYPVIALIIGGRVNGAVYPIKVTNTSPNTMVRIRDVDGYKTRNSGKAVFSGDGSTTQFSIAHGLVSAPNKVVVTPCSSDASGQFYVTVDDTYIYANYSAAPPSGTDNVCLYWEAEV